MSFNQLLELFIDFETYYTDKAHGSYSLSSMTCEEYVRDPRFEIIGFSIAKGNGPATWYSGDLEYCRSILKPLPWDRIVTIAHNGSEFDNLILTEIIGVRPAAYACTVQMARQLHGGKQSNSLDALCTLYGLPAKGKQVQNYINFRRADFSPAQLADYGDYCNNDTERGRDLYRRFYPQIPENELWLASLASKMFAEPRLALDTPLLGAMQHDMAVRKGQLLNRVADILNIPSEQQLGGHEQRMVMTQKALRSDATLARVFKEQYDIDPPMKFSPKKKDANGNPLQVYAFAKTDEGMDELLNYEDASDPEGAEDIQALAAARLGVKSTLAETRIARFIGIGSRGKMPSPLGYGRTHTSRLAGVQKINLQNLTGNKPITPRTQAGTLVMTPRGVERLWKYNKLTKQIMVADGTIFEGKDVHLCGLRDSIIAPPGKRIVVRDSSQIELRVAHLLAGQMDTIADLRAGVDTYCSFASTIYGRPITKADHKERQHGKVGMLQLQYQAGWRSFRNAARIMGGVRLTEDEAQGTVTVYRNRFDQIPKLWRACQNAIVKMAAGGTGGYIDQWGLCRIEHNRITMPGRNPLVYHNLRQEMLEGFNGGEPELQWVYDDKEKRKLKKVYGGSITENLCQWIARNVVFDQMLECERRWGNYHASGNGVVLTVHDEIVLVVDEDDADECLKFCGDVMGQAPAWWPQLPVTSDGGHGIRYSECK